MTTATSKNLGQQAMDYPCPFASKSAVQNGSKESLGRFLGYFSIGLGLAESLAPHVMAQLTGVGRKGLLRAFGLREIASGIGILSKASPAGWLWTRVAGDVLDILALRDGLSEADSQKRKRALTSLLAVAGVTALDLICAKCHTKPRTDG